MSQTEVYDYLEKKGESTILELAGELGITRNNVTTNLKRLMKGNDVRKLKRMRKMPTGHFRELFTINK